MMSAPTFTGNVARLDFLLGGSPSLMAARAEIALLFFERNAVRKGYLARFAH
jgi:hypothetical protein